VDFSMRADFAGWAPRIFHSRHDSCDPREKPPAVDCSKCRVGVFSRASGAVCSHVEVDKFLREMARELGELVELK